MLNVWKKIIHWKFFGKTCLSSKSPSGNVESLSDNSPDNFPPKNRFIQKIVKPPLPPLLPPFWKNYQSFVVEVRQNSVQFLKTLCTHLFVRKKFINKFILTHGRFFDKHVKKKVRKTKTTMKVWKEIFNGILFEVWNVFPQKFPLEA